MSGLWALRPGLPGACNRDAAAVMMTPRPHSPPVVEPDPFIMDLSASLPTVLMGWQLIREF